jgi:hypothetical protein
MRYGKLKLIENMQPHWGSAFNYWFMKVRSGPAEWQEEHWLITEKEATKFWHRGRKVFLGAVGLRGLLHPLPPREDQGYGSHCVVVKYPQGEPTLWVLTPSDIEVVRHRAEMNVEDIQANRESWLADLLD